MGDVTPGIGHEDERDAMRQAAVARVLGELTPLGPENAMYVAGEILTALDHA